MSASSVLIVDDDAGMLRRLGEAFTGAGYQVHTAADGEIALRRFQVVRPDVVLTDILMPTREGLETIMAMRKARPDTRIVAMSGGGRVGPFDCLAIARRLGADAVIPKPFRLAEVLALVASQARRPAPQLAMWGSRP